MRQTRLPAADRGIWIPGGGRRRVRSRRGDGDPFFDARGTTLAIAHDVFGPQRTLSVAPQFSQPDIQQKELLRGLRDFGQSRNRIVRQRNQSSHSMVEDPSQWC